MNHQIDIFHSFLRYFLQGEAALLTVDGDVLAIKGQNPLSYGTLPTAAQTVAKYLKLHEGDIAILNDPYSGGTTLNEMTFVVAISEDLLWVVREKFASHVCNGKSIEDEGLRIPPTPIFQKGQLNDIILGALEAHPLCPPQFVLWIKEQCQNLTTQAQRFVSALESSNLSVTSELIEDYWQLSKNLAKKLISDRTYGETRVDVVLDSGELLRMNLETSESGVTLDFSGTSGAKTVNLTESAVTSTCFHALATYFGFLDYANAGTLGLLQISKPSGCWLLAKYPASTFKGMVCGVAALRKAMQMALSHIHINSQRAPSSSCPLLIEVKSKGLSQVIRLSGGEGARKGRKGKNGDINTLSIELLEKDFPLRVHRLAERPCSGENSFSGGSGVILRLEALEPLELCWLTDLTLHRPRLTKGLTHGTPCEVSLEREGEVETLPVLGNETLKQGDFITFSSGIGGSFN